VPSSIETGELPEAMLGGTCLVLADIVRLVSVAHAKK